MHLDQSTDNPSSANEKRAREEDEEDSDADTPRSTGSSVTEVGSQAQLPSSYPKSNDALRTQSDPMDEDVKKESAEPASQTTTTGIAGSSLLSEEVASSLDALHINRVKGKARDSGEILHLGTPVPMTPESEAPDNESIAHRTRSAQRRKTSIDPIPSKGNDILLPSQSVETAPPEFSGSSSFLDESKSSSGWTTLPPAPSGSSSFLIKSNRSSHDPLYQPSAARQVVIPDSLQSSQRPSHSHHQRPSQSTQSQSTQSQSNQSQSTQSQNTQNQSHHPNQGTGGEKWHWEWFWFCVSFRLPSSDIDHLYHLVSMWPWTRPC